MKQPSTKPREVIYGKYWSVISQLCFQDGIERLEGSLARRTATNQLLIRTSQPKVPNPWNNLQQNRERSYMESIGQSSVNFASRMLSKGLKVVCHEGRQQNQLLIRTSQPPKVPNPWNNLQNNQKMSEDDAPHIAKWLVCSFSALE